MENNNFVQFTPIGLDFNPSPENIYSYYKTNNIKPDNNYMKEYINYVPESSESSDISEFSGGQEFLSKIKNLNYKKDNIDVSENDIITSIKNLNVSDEDKEYLSKLAKRESSYKPYVKNRFGYYGLYQFGDSALKATGFNKSDFDDPLNQHKAALKLANVNEVVFKKYLDKYNNKNFKGIKITKNGLRAASHLLGAGAVKDWFEGTTNTSIAKKGFVDGNGTSITEYLKMFS